ncbi:MAG: hypothetical protein HYW49_13615 [Deltaproteobacteria bacterium]|nr:hypothetical protein [Deltaproteobacteria bacterium]
MKNELKDIRACLIVFAVASIVSPFAISGGGQPAPIPANLDLQNCIEGLEPSDPNYFSDPSDCSGSGQIGFDGVAVDRKPLKLYQGGTSASNELTGFYDDTGKRCADQTGAAANCVFKIEAWVTPLCPKDSSGNPYAKCKRAETFTFEYQVSQVKSLPGMPTFATVKTGTTDRPNITVPYSAIRAAKYTYVDCKQLYPNNINMQYQSGVDSLGQPICGKDPNQDTIDALKDEMCKLKVQQVWQNGGSTQSPCDVIQIDKVFKLTANAAKTTTDCTSQGGTVYDGSTASPNLGAYPGGKITVNGTVTDEASFNKSKYGITGSSPTFGCKKEVTRQVTKSFQSSAASKGWEDTSTITTSGTWSYTFSNECSPSGGETFISGTYLSASASVSGSWDKVECRRENSCSSGGVDGGACNEGSHDGSGSLSSAVGVNVSSSTATGVTLNASYSMASYSTGRADKCKGHDNDFSGHDWCCTWISGLQISGSATIECKFEQNIN